MLLLSYPFFLFTPRRFIYSQTERERERERERVALCPKTHFTWDEREEKQQSIVHQSIPQSCLSLSLSLFFPSSFSHSLYFHLQTLLSFVQTLKRWLINHLSLSFSYHCLCSCVFVSCTLCSLSCDHTMWTTCLCMKEKSKGFPFFLLPFHFFWSFTKLYMEKLKRERERERKKERS